MYRAKAISYLGDENSYSFAAAKRLADGVYKPYGTMSKVMAAVENGECDYAVLPVENNVEGAVNEVYDMLYDAQLYIMRQIVLPVRHSLIAANGIAFENIRKVVSHPQALAQCRKFIAEHDYSVISVPSTSEALKSISCSADTAAIAFGPTVGQTVLLSDIQDSALNATRFSLLGKTPAASGNKASVSFDIKNKPGALLDVLRVINDSRVNMTRIISRPHRSGDGEYRFFVDFDCDMSDDALKDLLKSVGEQCVGLKYFGRYYCTDAKM